MSRKQVLKHRKGVIKAKKKEAKPLSITSPEYRRKVLDPRQAIQDYKAVHMRKKPKGLIDETIFYRKGKRIETKYFPATWDIVLAFALLNAVAVFWAKIVIYSEIGKPGIETITPSAEPVYVAEEVIKKSNE